jgi:signal transduction histidine kinase
VQELRSQLVRALLVIVTVAAVSCAVINFQQQSRYHLPDDGVTWADRPAGVVALTVRPGGPAEQRGIKAGDVVTAIAGQRVANANQVPQILGQIGAWSNALYTIQRNGVEFPAQIIVGQYVPDSAVYYQYAVGLAYLLIGFFVYSRRANAAHALHFYLLCLASFILSCFHYTGKLNSFDQVIYAGNVLAGILAPALFLHFCLAFPERNRGAKGRWQVTMVYLPAGVLVLLYFLLSQGMLLVSAPLAEVVWFLDRVWLCYLAACYLLGAVVLAVHHRQADDPTVRHQLKYLRNGVVIGIVPFTLIYVIPYVLGALPGHYQKMAVLSLAFIPITWAYAILRYRLMDVDIIFQQGYAYTLATLCVLGIFYGLIFSFTKPGELGPAAIVCLILFAAFIFQPIREWLQEQMDRYLFYKDRYDPRRTLIAFARELGAETDRDAMLKVVGERLAGALGLQRVAFFLYDEMAAGFYLHSTVSGRKENKHTAAEPLDLSFLSSAPDKPYYFFERTRRLVDLVSSEWPGSVRRTIADLDLTYYFACSVRGRTLGYLGISRTEEGDFLSRDDVDLLSTLSGYVGIAIENSRLYQSLQRKAEEYERLKEFSENIVESINVGILAADLDDRVGSWNPLMERLTGVSRLGAVGRPLRELFPEELCETFDRVRGEFGVHNIYKFTLRPQAASPFPNGNGNGNGNGNRHIKQVPPREAIVNLAIAPLFSKDGNRIGRLVIFDDVTDRDELERRLVQADKLSSIGLLAAGVAHEVNTPLAVISTYSQMLAKQISGDDRQSKLLEKIAKQTFRASEIVNSLLNFSRTSQTDFVEVDLNRVIRETLNLIEHQLQKARITVELSLDPALPAVKGNAGKLQQVFLNLLLNARDAMEEGGRLALRTWSEDDRVRAEVLDNGQGIPGENLQRIYDPFFTTKGARKGTGLGLSVTYGIVREHGGTIEVESEPGEGTRFHLEFPKARKAVHA